VAIAGAPYQERPKIVMIHHQLEKPFQRLGLKVGSLYAVRGKLLFRIHPWPTLQVEQRQADGRWQPLFGARRDAVVRRVEIDFEPRYSDFDRAAGFWWDKQSGQGCFEWGLHTFERRQASGELHLRRFSVSVPSRLRQAAEKMRFGLISSLELFRHVPAALDLVTHDQLLAVCLARHWRFRADGRKAWREVAGIVGLRRRRILGWLGFPPTEAAANALRRLQVDATEAGRVVPALRALMKCLNDPEVGPRLVRMSRIEPELVQLLATPRTRRLIGLSGLRCYTRLSYRRLLRVSSALDDISTWAELGLIEIVPDLRVSDLLALHRKLLRASRSPEAIKPFFADSLFPPAPPVDLTGARHIGSVHALLGEAINMEHCAARLDYVIEALRGDVAFFQIVLPVRATLALRCREGAWLLEDLRAKSNAEIAAEDRARILGPFEGLLQVARVPSAA
jgi:hypothetical protein